MSDEQQADRGERAAEIREVAEAYQFQFDERGWMAGQLLELLARVERYRETLEALRSVVKDDLLPICREHGGEIWMAEAFRIESVFEQVDEVLNDGEDDA